MNTLQVMETILFKSQTNGKKLKFVKASRVKLTKLKNLNNDTRSSYSPKFATKQRIRCPHKKAKECHKFSFFINCFFCQSTDKM